MSNSPDWSTRTFDNEDRLPRLPLPALEETCEAFLEWCAPLLTPQELAQTETAVAAFLRPAGPGQRLHAVVERNDAMPGVHSWLEMFWRDRYLYRRDRTALDTNVFFLFRHSNQGQLERAATLVAASVDYKLRLDAQLLPPDVERGQPLSMEQSKYLFGTTRIPGPQRDTVRAPYTKQSPGPSTARHIAVLFRGNLFRVDVLAPDGRPYTVDDLTPPLRAVMTAGAAPAAPNEAVGHLTTQPRAQWAASRLALLEHDPGNARALDAIETALFALCLEDLAPAGTLAACEQLLHGTGANRWFDKAISLVVFADGTAGLNAEHSRLDGATLLHFVETTVGATVGGAVGRPDLRSPDASRIPPAVDRIEFTLDDRLRATVGEAVTAFAMYRSNVASTILAFPDFGAERAKQLGSSPDAFVQMAFQLAYYRTKGFVGATYESIALRQYRHGRTGAMRVVTPEVLEFVHAMDDPDTGRASRRAALEQALQRHARRVRQCQEGQAPEHHLSELRRIQEQHGARLGVDRLPALYQTPGWLVMRDDHLSTSRVPTTQAQYFGFGPTGARCIGVAYRLVSDRMDLYLSAPRPIAADMNRFAEELREALPELEALLQGSRVD